MDPTCYSGGSGGFSWAALASGETRSDGLRPVTAAEKHTKGEHGDSGQGISEQVDVEDDVAEMVKIAEVMLDDEAWEEGEEQHLEEEAKIKILKTFRIFFIRRIEAYSLATSKRLRTC